MDFNFQPPHMNFSDTDPKIDSILIEANQKAVEQRQAILDTAEAVKELNSKIEDVQVDSDRQSKSSKRWNIAVFTVALLTLIATVVIGSIQLLR